MMVDMTAQCNASAAALRGRKACAVQYDASPLARSMVARSAERVAWLVDHCGVEVKPDTHHKHVGHAI